MSGNAVIGALRVNLGIDSAQFHHALKNAQSGMQKFGVTMKKGAMAAGAAMATAGAGISMAVKGVLNDADEMAKTAQKIGIPIDELGRLKHAAELSGVSFQGLQAGVRNLSKAMANLTDSNSPAVEALGKLGIETKNADGTLRSTSAVMSDVSAKFATMEDGAEKTAIAVAIFGKAGADLIPMLNGGADALQKMKDEADALGIVFTPEMAKNAEQFNDNLDRLSKVFGGIMTQIAGAMAGPLAGFTDWVVSMAKGFQELNPGLKDAVVRFGTFAAVAAPLVGVLGAVAAPFVLLGAPVAAAAAGFLALGGAVAYFWPEITKTASALTSFVQGAWENFRGAWDGMVTKVDEVKGAIANFAQAIVTTFAALPGQMVQIGSDIIAGLWNGISSKFSEVKDGLVNFGGELYEGLKAKLRIFSPSRVMHGIGVNIMQGLGNGMESMQGSVESIADSVASTLTSAFMGIIDGSKKVSDVLKDLFKQMASMLLNNAFRSLLGGLFGGGGGGFLGSLFGGFRKDGAPINAGRPFLIAENGAVLT